MVLTEGTEKYVNCVYVLSNLDKADKFFEVESFTKSDLLSGHSL